MWEQGFPIFFLILILSVGTRFSLFSLEYFEMRSVEASFSFEVYQCAAKKFRNAYMVDLVNLTMPISSMQISDSYHQCSGVLEASWFPNLFQTWVLTWVPT